MKGQTSQNIWVLILLLLAGVVLGGFIGDYLGVIPSLHWLSYGKSFGFTTPFSLDLGIIALQFALQIRFTIAGIIGIVIAILIYRKI